MNFDQLKSVYFIGIGGIGMSAIARFFHASGKQVSGYDKTPTSLTDELIKEGIKVHFEDNVEDAKLQTSNPKPQTLIVYTPAIPKEHKELNYFLNNGYNVKKRSEVLGMITENHFTVAVAGTHAAAHTSRRTGRRHIALRRAMTGNRTRQQPHAPE